MIVNGKVMRRPSNPSVFEPLEDEILELIKSPEGRKMEAKVPLGEHQTYFRRALRSYILRRLEWSGLLDTYRIRSSYDRERRILEVGLELK